MKTETIIELRNSISTDPTLQENFKKILATRRPPTEGVIKEELALGITNFPPFTINPEENVFREETLS
jgi:hypothetical protein